MSGFISDLIHGTSSRHYPRYHYDDSMVSYGGGMGMLPDVQLYVPMESMRDVERVKNALEREGNDWSTICPAKVACMSY
jgi:hypothetical protein